MAEDLAAITSSRLRFLSTLQEPHLIMIWAARRIFHALYLYNLKKDLLHPLKGFCAIEPLTSNGESPPKNFLRASSRSSVSVVGSTSNIYTSIIGALWRATPFPPTAAAMAKDKFVYSSGGFSTCMRTSSFLVSLISWIFTSSSSGFTFFLRFLRTSA